MLKEQTFDPIKFSQAVKEMQVSSTSSRIWLAKMREFEELVRDEKNFLSNRHRERAMATTDQIWYFNFSIEKAQQRLKEYELQYRKFSFYHDLALGRPMPEQFDIDSLKTINPKVLLGQPIVESGKIMTFKCPFHNEKTGSFVWYKKNNRGNCFGCGKLADIIDLFQVLNNCDFKEACKALKQFV